MNNRRKIIKSIGFGTAWSTPVVQTIILPAHAQTSATTPSSYECTLNSYTANIEPNNGTFSTDQEFILTLDYSFSNVPENFVLTVNAVSITTDEPNPNSNNPSILFTGINENATASESFSVNGFYGVANPSVQPITFTSLDGEIRLPEVNCTNFSSEFFSIPIDITIE